MTSNITYIANCLEIKLGYCFSYLMLDQWPEVAFRAKPGKIVGKYYVPQWFFFLYLTKIFRYFNLFLFPIHISFYISYLITKSRIKEPGKSYFNSSHSLAPIEFWCWWKLVEMNWEQWWMSLEYTFWWFIFVFNNTQTSAFSLPPIYLLLARKIVNDWFITF